MAQASELGKQISQWVKDDPRLSKNTQLLLNRMKDLLGSESDEIRGPLIDIITQPLFHESLALNGASKDLAANELQKYIRNTYSHSICLQLKSFVEAASGVVVIKNVDPAYNVGNKTDSRELLRQANNLVKINIKSVVGKTYEYFHLYAPGIAVSAAFALVFAWLGGEIDRFKFGKLSQGCGLLILLLGIVELSRFVKLKVRNKTDKFMINSLEVTKPSYAWKWISHPFVHANAKEGVINIFILLIILGGTPLPLSEVLLRFNLTSLACLIGAASCAKKFEIAKVWSGASGSVAALISLACCLSLFENRPLAFDVGWISVPAWVLLVINSSLQMQWQIDQRAQNTGKYFSHIVLSSTFAWGTILGSLWAVFTIFQRVI